MRGKLVVLTAIIVAFLVGATTMHLYNENKKEENVVVTKDTTDRNKTQVIKCNNDITVDETGVSTAVGEIYDATVMIQNYQANGRLVSSGSGFVYKKTEKYGYIMTNHHVIEDASKVVITLSDDNQVEAEILGSDKYIDLAVLRIDAKYVKQVAKIGTSENSVLGDTVITVGTPIGYEYRGTVTRGTLSGKDRLVEVTVVTPNDFVMRVLQVDAAINPGNSGGPLANINGEVIGINSLKLVQDQIEGMGFAIPIEYAMEYVDQLEKGQKIDKPFIGITMIDVTNKYKLYQNAITVSDDIKSGVVISETEKDGSARKAGIERGDIIVAINNTEVTNSAFLKYELYKYKVGDTIEITYIRNGKTKKTKLTLTKIEE